MLRKKTYVNLTTTPAPPLFCSSRRGCHFLQPTSPAQTLVHLLSNAQWEQWLVEINLLDWRRVVKRKKGKSKKNATRTAVLEGYTFLTVVIYCVYIYICIHSVYDLARNGECSVDFLPASNSELLVENRIGSWKAVFLLQCLASRTLFIKILTLGEYNKSEGYLPK